jgi:hypothetical protein
MNDNPIRRDARMARRQRTLGPDARCACGEADLRCLVITGEGVQCYACRGSQVGRSGIERHHVAGRHNLSGTVPIPSNDHRVLSDFQQDWPTNTVCNLDGSPLLQAAAAIRGWMDILVLILERIIGWIPRFLEALDAWLRERLGPGWAGEFLAVHPNIVPPLPRGGGR